MRTIFENRASTILYNIILSNKINRGISILPANICPIVPATFMKAKAKFIFVDIDNNSLLISKEKLMGILKNNKTITSILFNHTYGVEVENQELFKNIKDISENIIIIDDRCLTKPKLSPDKFSLADITMYSTGYSKFVDFNYGGYTFVNEKIKYKKINLEYSDSDYDKLIENFNKVLNKKTRYIYKDSNWLDTRKPKYTFKEYTVKLEEILPKITQHKKNINKIYYEKINTKFQMGKEYANWRFNILVENKEFLLKKIFENKLFASSHYQSLVGIFGTGEQKNTERLHSKVINLFNDFRFNEEMAEKISNVVNKYAK